MGNIIPKIDYGYCNMCNRDHFYPCNSWISNYKWIFRSELKIKESDCVEKQSEEFINQLV